MKPRVLLIRADASQAIGTGHVMRCVALAQAWQDAGGTTGLAAAELPEELFPRVTAEGISLRRIHASPGSLADAAETVAQASDLAADWIVIDGDRFDSDFLQTVRGARGFRVLLVDDFANRDSFPADLIVNPNLDENEEPYRKRGATAQLAMGPSHVLLRREFRRGNAKKLVRQSGNRILVTLGGSDPENLTPAIAQSLARRPELEVTAVVGAGYRNLRDLRMLNASNLRVLLNPPSMAQLMRDSDQAIIAAGGTLWELLSMGCAVLSYSRNAVQTGVVRALAERGVVVDMGETRSFEATKLVVSVKGLVDSPKVRERMASLGHALVEGWGASRVVEAMQRLGAR